MKAYARVVACSLAGCLLFLSGCASIPRSRVPESQFAQLNCAQLEAEVVQNEETKRVATQTKTGAWKAVVPVAVVARYAKGSSAITTADKRGASLEEQRRQKGCASAAN
jgi:hypothetical protein